jgi:hypothetical protein
MFEITRVPITQTGRDKIQKRSEQMHCSGNVVNGLSGQDVHEDAESQNYDDQPRRRQRIPHRRDHSVVPSVSTGSMLIVGMQAYVEVTWDSLHRRLTNAVSSSISSISNRVVLSQP